LIISQAEQILNKNNLTSDSTIANIYLDNKTVIVETSNQTITNQVKTNDFSKEGLVPKEVIEEIKSKVDFVSDLIVSTAINSKSNLDVFYSTNTFTVQIYDTSSTFNQKSDLQIKNGLSIIDFDQCAMDLKVYYNFTSDVIIGKIDYNPKLESRSSFGDVRIKYYSPVNGTELPFENICKNTSLIVKFPLKEIPIDKKEYEKYISDGFNIYDSQSEFYSSRCMPLMNSTSEGDVTISERIEKIYKNISISCGDKCLFNEIDANNYTVCNCMKKGDTKAFVEKIVFSGYSLYNIDIITCYKNFTWVKNYKDSFIILKLINQILI